MHQGTSAPEAGFGSGAQQRLARASRRQQLAQGLADRADGVLQPPRSAVRDHDVRDRGHAPTVARPYGDTNHGMEMTGVQDRVRRSAWHVLRSLEDRPEITEMEPTTAYQRMLGASPSQERIPVGRLNRYLESLRLEPTWGKRGPHSGSLHFADKDEVPGSSPGRPTT